MWKWKNIQWDMVSLIMIMLVKRDLAKLLRLNAIKKKPFITLIYPEKLSHAL